MKTTDNHVEATIEQSTQDGIVTLPIPLTTYNNAVDSFLRTYRTSAGLNYSPISFDFEGLLKSLFTINSTTANGLVFHYGMSPSDKELYYILSAGSQVTSSKKVSFRPFTAAELGTVNPGYILLMRGTSRKHKIIDIADLSTYQRNYKNALERKVGTANWQGISQDPAHPYYIYHQGSELKSFYESYKTNDPMYLYIHHGSDNPNLASIKYHLPILRFGKSNCEFVLDNLPLSAGNYVGKALDAGNLCPPFN